MFIVCYGLEFMYIQLLQPKVHRAAKGNKRACNIHGRQMLSVTKYSFQMYFQYVYCLIFVPHFSLEWSSAALVFGEDLACKLEIKKFSDTEGAIG